MSEQGKRPPGWDAAPVWGHIDTMWSNIQASHVHLARDRKRLEVISGFFDEISTEWQNPEQRIGAMLFLRSLSAFRVSIALGMCSPVEMYPVLRLSLECASYAHIMAKDSLLQSVWLRRAESPEQEKACRKAFAPEKIKASLSDSDPDLKRVYSQLYDHAIMLGAHPNELSVTSAMNIRDSDDGSLRLEEMVMLPASGPLLSVSMVTAARVGLCSLLIFQHVFPRRYADLKLSDRLSAQRQGL